MLLPETSARDATVVAERLRNAVKELVVVHEGTPLTFTCSIGVAERGSGIESVDSLLSAADEALYEAKRSGRDRVVRHRSVS